MNSHTLPNRHELAKADPDNYQCKDTCSKCIEECPTCGGRPTLHNRLCVLNKSKVKL